MQYTVHSWEPNYFKKFRCNGVKCNAKCCKNWDIEIDDATYLKYQQLSNLADREKILASIIASNNKYIIKVNEQNICPLLCQDSLCYVQRHYGADALSETCQIYPRMLIRRGSYQLQALSMTCPLAADEALFGPDSMALIQSSDNTSIDNAAWKKILQNVTLKDDAFGSIMESIVLGSMMILYNQTYTRDARMFLLGLFLDKVDELTDFVNADNLIADLAIKYQTAEFQQQLQALAASLEYNSISHRDLVKKLLERLAKETDLQDIRYLLYLPDDYYTNYYTWRKTIDDIYGSAIDNLWVQEFLYQGYPCRLAGSCMHNFSVYLLSYALWDVLLYNHYHSCNNIIDKEAFISLVGKFCTIIDHKIDFLNLLEPCIADYENNPMDFMQMMLHL